MSPELKRFYRDILKAIESGEKPRFMYHVSYARVSPGLNGISHDHGYRSSALCAALAHWPDENSLTLDEFSAVYNEMKQQFRDAGLNETFPFNMPEDGSDNWAEAYLDEGKNGKTYTNPKRLAWVKEHAA